MAYVPHFRARFFGFLGSAEQTWSCGINFVLQTGPLDPNDAGNQSYLERWRDGIVALNGGNILPPVLASLLSSRDALTGVRCSVIGTDGKEVSVAQYERGTPLMGSGNVRMPQQVSVAISWVTGIPGRANAGRVYWPAIGATLTTDGRLGSPSPQSIADGAAGFLNDVRGAGAGVTDPARFAAVVGTKGTSNRIDRVRVGNRLDIQRRRADKEKESYSVAQVSQ